MHNLNIYKYVVKILLFATVEILFFKPSDGYLLLFVLSGVICAYVHELVRWPGVDAVGGRVLW